MNKLIVIVVFILSYTSSFFATPIKVSSNQGMKIMSVAIENGSAKTYIKSAENFAPQNNLLFCGPATVAIILNTMGVKRPFNAMYSPYSLFNQINIFNKQLADTGITLTSVLTNPGMDIDQVTKMLNTFSTVNAVFHKAMKENQETMKSNIINTLKYRDFVIASIQRTCMGEEGGGHFSPISSYAKYNGKLYFLFMDVSAYKNFGHVWVEASELYKGMSDQCDGYNGRGYIIIKATN